MLVDNVFSKDSKNKMIDEVDVGSKEDLEDNLTEPYEVLLTASDWTVETILSLVKKGIIDINPDFQRREAWNAERKSFFIESIMLGLPIPQIILAEQDRRYIVVDGRQRLLSLLQFVAKENSSYNILRLKGLSKLKDLNGKSYHEIKSDFLVNNYALDFDTATIRTAVLKKWNKDSLYDMFLRINQGSVILSPQELRQALYPGEFTTYIQKTSADKAICFRKILRNSNPDPRMRDAELLLRYFAVKNMLNESYNGNMKLLLDSTCEYFNKVWEEQAEKIKEQTLELNSAYDFAIEAFEGINPFSKYDEAKQSSSFNRAVFDFIIYFFSNVDIRNKLKKIPFFKEKLKRAFIDMFQDTEFVAAVTSSTKNRKEFSKRMCSWANKLSEILGERVESPL